MCVNNTTIALKFSFNIHRKIKILITIFSVNMCGDKKISKENEVEISYTDIYS